jgi:hypothetical protein
MVGNGTFSSSRSDIDDERHRAQSPVEEGSCDQQAITETSIGHRNLAQALLMLDFRREERIRLDALVRRIRAKFRGNVALDADSKRCIKESLLSFHGCWDVSQA